MRISMITLTSDSSAINIPVVGATSSDKYILRAVDGLGPSDIDVFMVDLPDQGGYYQGQRPHNRQIALTLLLNPDYSSGEDARDLRLALYDALSSRTSPVTVTLSYEGVAVAMTKGYASKLPIEAFSKESLVQITIDCMSAYLQTPSPLVINPVGTQVTTLEADINNVGSVPSGMKANFTAKVGTIGFTFQVDSDALPGQSQIWKYTPTFGDENAITFVTIPGQLQATRIQSPQGGSPGPSVNLLPGMVLTSVWPMLYPGNNHITVKAIQPNIEKFIWDQIEYTPQYLGV